MGFIFLFLDGVGIGSMGDKNPFYVGDYKSFEYLAGDVFTDRAEFIYQKDHIYKAIDANLGVDGLPQSGTGQTTLFTGKNASNLIGKHFGPFPHSGIKPLLMEKSIFHELQDMGKTPYFMNAYPPVFFERAERSKRWSCTTLMAKSAGIRLNSTKEIVSEEALTAEIVQNAWRDLLNIPIPKITPTEAAQRLLNVVPKYDLVLYEYYLTDKAGHNKSHTDAERVLQPLDEFLIHILKNKRSEDVLLITSDHGNIEDLSTKSHTRNPVPLFAIGRGAEIFKNVESLVDVKGSILDWLK